MGGGTQENRPPVFIGAKLIMGVGGGVGMQENRPPVFIGAKLIMGACGANFARTAAALLKTRQGFVACARTVAGSW